ncbi:MAG: inorganic phosphate transporter [Candidatus Bathyarchaeia archaeon]
MDSILLIAILLAFYVAWSIGSNDITMGPLAGSGFLNILMITAIGGISTFLGAMLLGQNVEHTLGNELLSGSITSVETLIIVFSIATWITISSWRGWAISTTHSAIGSAVGLGLVKWGLSGVAWRRIYGVVGAWIASPFIGLGFSYILWKIFSAFLQRYVRGFLNYVKLSRYSAYLLLLFCSFMSFVRGANDIGNATAFISVKVAYNPLLVRGLAGIGMLLGLMILGRTVLKSVGLEIIKITPLKGLSVEICTSMILFVATLWGIPLSSTHILIGSIVGVGLAEDTWVNFSKLITLMLTWIGTFLGAATICIIVYLVVDLI